MQTSYLHTPASELMKSLYDDKQAARNFFFDEIFKMTKVGDWEIDLINNTVIWSEQTKRIHEVYNDYKPTVEKAVSFFCGTSRNLLIDRYKRLVETGKPYDEELEFITAHYYLTY